jgi:periplasmic mercuric ion binding protein
LLFRIFLNNFAIKKKDMKTQNHFLAISVLIIIAGFLFTDYAEAKTLMHDHNTTEAEFKVLGNCGMCTARIEKAAKSVSGVTSAKYDLEAQTIKVNYKTDKTTQEAIEKAIAKVGHDTENFKTDTKTYNNLHSCCKYPREKE